MVQFLGQTSRGRFTQYHETHTALSHTHTHTADHTHSHTHAADPALVWNNTGTHIQTQQKKKANVPFTLLYFKGNFIKS